jgi:NAD(P)-dependent dehydrogenase (short-subunit alcohol dehydrogenase family)
MKINDQAAVVTGGGSGLGRATARRLVEAGAGRVVLFDLPSSPGEQAADELGDAATFVPGDVTVSEDVVRAVRVASEHVPLRILVHCAGRGGPVRLVDKEGRPGSLETFEMIVRTNLVGTFNVLRLAAAAMAANDPVDGERGVCVLTASIAAWEGQIGQTPYASSKAGVVGMTLVAARDLASRLVRVCCIAPGTFDTPMLSRLTPEMREGLASAIPHPRRLGHPDEYASLAEHIIGNPMLNGETIRIDGALRMAPR